MKKILKNAYASQKDNLPKMLQNLDNVNFHSIVNQQNKPEWLIQITPRVINNIISKYIKTVNELDAVKQEFTEFSEKIEHLTEENKKLKKELEDKNKEYIALEKANEGLIKATENVEPIKNFSRSPKSYLKKAIDDGYICRNKLNVSGGLPSLGKKSK